MRRSFFVIVAAVLLLAVGAFAPAEPAEASHWSYCVALAPGSSPFPFLVETSNLSLVPNPKACVASNYGHTNLSPWPPGFCGFASIGAAIFQCTPPCGVTGSVTVTVTGPIGSVGSATCTNTTTGHTTTASCIVTIGTSCTKKEPYPMPPPAPPAPFGNSLTCTIAPPPGQLAIVHCTP